VYKNAVFGFHQISHFLYFITTCNRLKKNNTVSILQKCRQKKEILKHFQKNEKNHLPNQTFYDIIVCRSVERAGITDKISDTCNLSA
jgi:hypothetical protein